MTHRSAVVGSCLLSLVVLLLLPLTASARVAPAGIQLIYDTTDNPHAATFLFYERDGASYSGVPLARCSTRSGYDACDTFNVHTWKCAGAAASSCTSVTGIQLASAEDMGSAAWTDANGPYSITSSGVFLLRGGALKQLETSFVYVSGSLSLSSEATQSSSGSPSSNRSATPSESVSTSETFTVTVSDSADSATQLLSASFTVTTSGDSASLSPTTTDSPMPTQTKSLSPTDSRSFSDTPSPDGASMSETVAGLTLSNTSIGTKTVSDSLDPSTMTRSVTPTGSPTASQSRSHTDSWSDTRSLSVDLPSVTSSDTHFASLTASLTLTGGSPSTTMNVTESQASDSRSSTTDRTASSTINLTASDTSSKTFTAHGATASITFSASQTVSDTDSPTLSLTVNISESSTLSASHTAVLSDSFSRSLTRNATPTFTFDASASASASKTVTSTLSQTQGASMTFTTTPSMTQQGSATVTLSDTAFRSITEGSPTRSLASMTLSFTVDATRTATPTPTVTVTHSLDVPITDSASFSWSATAGGGSATVTATLSGTPESPSLTQQHSATRTRSRASITKTLSLTATPSPTATYTLSPTGSPSVSWSETLTDQRSETAPSLSRSCSASASLTQAASGTRSASRTASATVSSAQTLSDSPSASRSVSQHVSVSHESPSVSATVTVTASDSRTGPTVSATLSAFLTSTQSSTDTRSRGTASPSPSDDATHTETATAAQSATPSDSATLSMSRTAGTVSDGTTATVTGSLTAPVTGSPSETHTASLTLTSKPTLSDSLSRGTASPSASLSPTRSNTPSPTLTPSDSLSASSSPSESFSASVSTTASGCSVTAAASMTISADATQTRSISHSQDTPTTSFTGSDVRSDTSSFSVSSVRSSTASVTPTGAVSFTSSESFSLNWTHTMPVTESHSPPTQTESATVNASWSPTIQISPTHVDTPTRSLNDSVSTTVSPTPSLGISDSELTKTLRLTRTLTVECKDFDPVSAASDLVQAIASTQPFLIPDIQSNSKLNFIIPRDVISAESMNITLFTTFPQLFRTSPLSVTLQVDGPSVTVKGEILNRTSMVLYFSPVELPYVQSKFVDLSLRVTVSRQNFRCDSHWPDMPIVIAVQGADRAVDAASKNAVAGAATATSIAGANPAAAATQARTKMLSALVACSFDLVSDNGNSVTGLHFGVPKGQYLRGSIVGNWCIIFVFSIAMILVASTSARIVHRRHGLPMKDAWVTMVCILHLPSVFLVPLGLVLQPTVSSTITLIMYPTGSSDAILAAASVIGILVLLGLMLVTCFARFECELAEDGETLPADAGPLATAWFYLGRFFDGRHIWRTRRGCDPLWRMKYFLIFNDYCYSWFAVVEVAISVAMGVVNGVKIDSENACFIQLCFMLALYSIIMLCVVLLRPGMSPFIQLFLLLANVVGFVCCVLILVGIVTGNNTAFAFNDYLIMLLFVMASIVSLKEMVKMVVAIPLLIRFIVTFHKHPSLMTETELEAHKLKLKQQEHEKVLELVALEAGDAYYGAHAAYYSPGAFSVLAHDMDMLPGRGLQERHDDDDPFAFSPSSLLHRQSVVSSAGRAGSSSASPMSVQRRAAQPQLHNDEATRWASPHSAYIPRRGSTRNIGDGSDDRFSRATAKTSDMDIRTLPSIARVHSSGESSSVGSSSDADPRRGGGGGGGGGGGRTSSATQTATTARHALAVSPRQLQPAMSSSVRASMASTRSGGGSARPVARSSSSFWRAMESGTAVPNDDDDQDPFADAPPGNALPPARPPSIWRQFAEGEGDDADADRAQRERERRRRRKTGDIDDLL